METSTRKLSHTQELTYIAISVVLIAICSWISIPATVPFTMQTFAVFAVVGLLGGKRGAIAILIYILLGAIGIPVFAGPSGGIGVLLGTTGGYIVGFFFSALIMWLMEKLPWNRMLVLGLSMFTGLLVCYAFGSLWFLAVYARTTGPIGLAAVLGWCVVPFLIPDFIKIMLALFIVKRVGRYVR